MQPVPVPSARRGLLDRPQRLGFLPTLWFWNDRERYRLAFPLVLVLSLPLVPLTFFLVVRLQLHFLLIVVVNTLAPYVALGFIERHMRGELRRRELAGPEVGGELEQTSPSDMLTPLSARLYLTLAVLGGVATVLAVGQLWGALAATLSVMTLTLWFCVAGRLSHRTRALGASAAALVRPNEPKQLRPESPR